ncbi:MAG: energy-coupling factor ABC transporter ATP-binding protein [Nitrososphaerales archaeon]|nr:energy-coupling factor ABC transporter ATP-binding protein [Nitrososphaerales archaeon]
MSSPPRESAGELAAEFKDVTWVYNETTKPALEGINLTIKTGEVVVITGPSGAGKTTLCRCFNGLIPHFFEGELRGSVNICGMDVSSFDIPYLAAKAGLLFDDPSNQLFNSTVEEELAFGPANYAVPREEIFARIDEGLEFARLQDARMKSPHALSGGQQQACALAAIYTMRPEIFVLDEPTSNLDPYGAQLIFQRLSALIAGGNRTFVVVEHNLESILPYAQRLIVMDKGRILADGPPHEVLRRIEPMEGLDLQVPHATQLAFELEKRGLAKGELPFTTEGAVRLLDESLKKLKRTKPAASSRPGVADPADADAANAIVEVQDVRFAYPDGTEALKGISLKIPEGGYVGFIGRNGSGKTTLVKLLNGLLRPTSGSVRVCGEDISGKAITQLARLVGYNFQNPDDQIFARTVRQELEFAPKNLGLSLEEAAKAVEAVAKDLELTPYLQLNPFSLSQGLRRRVAFGSTLTLNPKILVVDEPTTGQDYSRAKVIMELCKKLNEEGKTIIIISHNMDLIAEYCKHIYVLKDGSLLTEGTPRYVFSKPEVLIQTSIVPPQITRIFQQAREPGLPPDILTMPEALQALGLDGGKS